MAANLAMDEGKGIEWVDPGSDSFYCFLGLDEADRSFALCQVGVVVRVGVDGSAGGDASVVGGVVLIVRTTIMVYV